MAAHERLNTKASIASPTLIQQLAAVLSKGFTFKIYHLCTPPTRTDALYAAPPGGRPDRTYCESHFLSVSIAVPGEEGEVREVLVYAIEVLIYSTAFDTTFFVSKADSTGYLHLLGLSRGTPSPIRDISATFLRHLVDQHQRPEIRSVISLFARAQDQYLFPGSVEYSGKHVLDDRGLVRWWSRVLDPLIEVSKTSNGSTGAWESVQGYLTVPGLDVHETTSHLPNRNASKSWTIGHPLREISRHPEDVPPRCFIPHYPDDPKARYLDELDEEISKGRSSSNGQWKSVKSIDQFWDMMAFRQECSAGRLVGFMWIVFTPQAQQQPTKSVLGDSQSTFMSSQTWDTDVNLSPNSNSRPFPITPATSFNASSQVLPFSSPLKPKFDDPVPAAEKASSSHLRTPPKKKKKKLTGPIITRKARVKTENKNYLLDKPETSSYYIWRPEGRGQVVVDESDYKRVTELLLRLDFANLELATSSSKRWINEVRSGAWGSSGDAWGQTVTGEKALEARAAVGVAGVATLNMGLLRKKRKDAPEEANAAPALPVFDAAPAVNVLSAGMVRKKAKV